MTRLTIERTRIEQVRVSFEAPLGEPRRDTRQPQAGEATGGHESTAESRGDAKMLGRAGACGREPAAPLTGSVTVARYCSVPEMCEITVDFDPAFKALTGHAPFPWQRELFARLSAGDPPPAIDIPTGLGKTAVMVIWLLARARRASLPRRLVYVVDRRAVVDQATTDAERLRKNLDDPGLEPVRRRLGLAGRRLPISTLRGQHADNRQWLDDPAGPAIIVGTVDMIGSRLLFEGYGVSRRMRPFQAGLLGCDTARAADEAHLAGPFQRLLRTIERGRRPGTGDAEPEAGSSPALTSVTVSRRRSGAAAVGHPGAASGPEKPFTLSGGR